MTMEQLKPAAWLCELMQEDGTARTMIVTENPDGLRWNDSGEPSPFRVTPLYAGESLKQLVREVCADVMLHGGMRRTLAMEAAMEQATGNRGLYPHALDTLAQWATAAK